MTMLARDALRAHTGRCTAKRFIRENWLPAVVAGVLCATLVTGFNRTPPISFDPGFVVNDPVMPGQVLQVRWHHEWKRACVVEVARQLVLPRAPGASVAEVKTFESRAVQPPATLGQHVRVTSIAVPDSVRPGVATYRAKITVPVQVSWDCFTLWPLEFASPDVHFVVRDPRGG
jgi:hypothetical protein